VRLITALIASFSLIAPAVAAPPANEPGGNGRRFFLFIASEPPLGTLVESAHRDAQKWTPTEGVDAARASLSKAYPRLFDAGRASDIRTLETDLKAGTDAHYNASFAAAEGHFARAIEFAFNEPEVLSTNPDTLSRLADAAALRYKNALALKSEPAKAMSELERFARRFPSVSITSTNHLPNIVEAWDAARKKVRETSGTLLVSVHPVEFERSGECQLFINGVRFGTMPLAGPVQLPQADHQVQVRCGVRHAWLQNVAITPRGVSLIVPVRAMIAARGDFATGGIVLVAPAEGDGSALVTAVSQAAGFDGAVVMRTAPSRLELGRQDMGTSGPTREAVAQLDGDSIGAWKKAEMAAAPSGGGVGPWQWVTGGVGVAALATGIVANVMYVNDFDANKRENLDTLASVSLAGYIAGGALLATSVVLFIVDASSSSEPAKSSFAPGRGGLFTVRF
jgi:hypothetical protein